MKQDIENIIKKCKRCSLPQSEWKGRWEKPLCKVGETTYEQHILEETESKSIKEQLEEVIKNNLPEEKIISNEEFNSIQEDYSGGLLEGEILGHNQCLSQINTSLIADEVLKVVVEEIKELPSRCRKCEKIGTNPYGECECSYEDRNFVKKQDVINLLSNLSPNKENKKYMSYIPIKYTLNVKVKDNTNWNSDDTDYVSSKIKSLQFELEKMVGDKFLIEFNCE